MKTEIRPVPDRLFRTDAGRLHLTNRCSGGAAPNRVRAVRLSQRKFEEAVRADRVCRCVRPWRDAPEVTR